MFKERHTRTWTCIYILIIIIAILSLFRGILVKPDTAVRALEIQGYSNIQITDTAWFMVGLRGGDRYDAARFTAIAINPIGKAVQVYVFVGWPFKGATIRTM